MKQYRDWLACFLVMVMIGPLAAQKRGAGFSHVEPPFWWVGMKEKQLQLLFHHPSIEISQYKAELQYPGVALVEQKNVENPRYTFLTLNIDADAAPGMVPITFKSGRKQIRYSYELKARETHTNRIQGFNPSDVIYLIMPDRFANGDVSNDSIPGMFEGVNRSKGGSRHGGDLAGIINKLDYLSDLGVTALWLNPVLENNQRRASYHGYAITDLYQVDRRFGGNEAYLDLIERCHKRGMKVIQDMVMNHIGNEHWLALDPPEKSWIHQFPEFTRSNYRSTVLSDPYAAEGDTRKMNDGWFDTTMPDVDQTNPLFATYLIQNTLWWIEHAGIDGIRMDTYPYPDKHFMAEWARRVMEEYPKFNIVGEVWINNAAATAYWQDGSPNQDQYRSYLPSVTDFPLFFALPPALNEKGGWDTGLIRLHETLSYDFVYPNPAGNVIFLDNHDLTRFFLLVERDIRKFKMGLTFLLTTRGIPQLYYGTELLMDGDGGHHPNVRLDFPGGWPDDSVNAFTPEGRTASQNEAFDFIRTLLQWRKKSDVIHNGKLKHYIPENNVYVYFRYNEKKAVMVALNGNDEEVKLDSKRFNENIKNARNAKDVLNNKIIKEIDTLVLPPMSATVLELESVQRTD